MALKIYKKAEINVTSGTEPKKTVELFAKREKAESPKSGAGRPRFDITIRIVSILLLVTGAFILLYTAYPYASYYLGKLKSNGGQALLSAGGDGDVLSVDSRFSNQYFDNVEENIARVSTELTASQEDFSSISGEFYLSIPDLKISRVPVKLNVNSFDEDEYLSVLRSYFAHFKGSSIPGKTGTIFVYSHSTSELYARANPNYIPGMFTFLADLSIGDLIFAEYEGVKYTYSVVRIHEVHPSDLSPVFEPTSKKLLKLMTCSPPGIGTDRLIVVTEQVRQEKI